MWRTMIASALALMALAGCGEKEVKAEEKAARKDVQLTIYKDDFAMVREVRPVTLKGGRNQIAVQDVSAVLDPRSVLFDWGRGFPEPQASEERSARALNPTYMEAKSRLEQDRAVLAGLREHFGDKDPRVVSLKKAVHDDEQLLMNTPEFIDRPASKQPPPPAIPGPTIVSNTYDVGVANGEALVKRYLGKPVELVRYGDNGKQADSQKGVLMAAEGGGYVLQTDKNFYINPPGTIIAPAERGVVTIPRLSVVVETDKDSKEDLEVAYLTRGLSWTADYVGIVDPNSTKLALQCWATVENRAGVDFPDAKITLVAGSPNRAAMPQAKMQAREYGFDGTNTTDVGSVPLRYGFGRSANMPALPEPVGDLQSYAVKSSSTIAQAQLNRLLLLESRSVEAKKDYSVRLPDIAAYDYAYYWPADRPGHPKVTAAFTFFNREKGGLGAALPGGAIRLYEGSEGSLQYIGGATISDTPVGEKINFTLGNVFDLTTTNRIVSKQKVGKQVVKTAEVVLRNQKKGPAEVRVVQPISGTWKLASESSKSTPLDAHTLQWKVSVPSGGEVKLRYTLMMRG